MNSKKPDDFGQLIQMIVAKNGNKSEVCRAFGISRQTLNTWEKEHPEIKQAFDDEREKFLDYAESQAKLLIKGIPKTEIDKQTGREVIVSWVEKPSEKMITYILSHLGRERGYTSTQHMDITTNGKDLNANVQVYILPDGTELKF